MEEQKKTSNARVAIRTIVFIALVIALFVYLNMATLLKGNDMSRGAVEAFYDLPENSIDIAYIGNSGVSRYYIEPKAFHDYGIAGFSLGLPNLPPYFFPDIISEIDRTQNPQLYIIELRPFRKGYVKVTESQARNTLDMVDLFSPNRISMINKARERINRGNASFLDYFLPISKYHSRVVNGELTAADYLIQFPTNSTQGYVLGKPTILQRPIPKFRQNFYDGLEEVTPTMQISINELTDYLEANDKQALFVLAPYAANILNQERLNAVVQYVRDKGYDVLDMNNQEAFEAIGLDWETDFCDLSHVNYLGAEKYTDYVSKYVKEHYDLPDHRGDPTYARWEESYQLYSDYTKNGIRYHEEYDTNDKALWLEDSKAAIEASGSTSETDEGSASTSEDNGDPFGFSDS